MSPLGWKSAMLPFEANVLIEHEHRKASGDWVRARRADGAGAYDAMRISRIAAVELAFLDRHDLAEKIAQVQFPGGAGGAGVV